MSFSASLGVIELPAKEAMTGGDHLGHSLEPKQEATRIQAGEIFRGGKFKRDQECHKTGHSSEERKPRQQVSICTVLKQQNK